MKQAGGLKALIRSKPASLCPLGDCWRCLSLSRGSSATSTSAAYDCAWGDGGSEKGRCNPWESVSGASVQFTGLHKKLGVTNTAWEGFYQRSEVSGRLGSCKETLECATWGKSCEEEQLNEVVKALDFLVQRECYVPASIFHTVIKGCTADQDVVAGRHVHALTVQSGHESNTSLANKIISMYAAHGKLQWATQVFSSVAAPSSSTWASMILAFAQHGEPWQAINMYRQMREAAVEPTSHIFVAVLKACARAADLASGKEVHADILGSVVQPNTFVGNCLVTMYAKCGSVADARRVFDSLPTKDLATWNAMIAGYAQHGFGQHALSLFAIKQQEEIASANYVTFLCLLKACARSRASSEGKKLHFQIRKRGLEDDVVLGSSLVDMYAKCGLLQDAQRVFDRLPSKNVVTWTAIIGGYAEHGFGQEALNLYSRMQEDCVSPANHVTFVCLLKACASVGALHEVKRVHSQIQEKGLDTDMAVGNRLVDSYVKCGNLNDARAVFDKLPAKDSMSWNLMISGYVHQGLGHEALILYARMEKEAGSSSDCSTFGCLLRACSSVRALRQGKDLHDAIKRQGLETDDRLGNNLVEMYAKCGAMEDARGVFERLHMKDITSWNALIAAYVENGQNYDAVALYQRMQVEGVTEADRATFLSLLKAAASLGALHQGKQLHFKIKERGLESDVVVGSCLVDMYAKCHSLQDACELFERLPTKNVVTWTALITGYARHGLGKEALYLFEKMQLDGATVADNVTLGCVLRVCADVRSLDKGREVHSQIEERGLAGDVIIDNSLVDMYAKCGSLEEARRVFDRLPTRDVLAWNAIISGYAEHGLAQEALSLFASMQGESTIQADHITYVGLLKACARVRALQEGKELHAQIQKRGLEGHVIVGNGLIDMYAKCGDLDNARIVFERLPARDVVTWTAMISGYAQHGLGQEALSVYERMLEEGLTPTDHVTYACLLRACASIGSIHHGKQVHSQIQKRELEGEVIIGNGLVDMYAKCGSLEDARRVFDRLPARDVVTWTSMISGYAQQGLGQEALVLYDSMQQEDIAADPVTFVCLLKACASIGAVNQGKKIHSQIQERGLDCDLVVGNALVDMYAKCGDLADARSVFDKFPSRDVVSWTALLNGYCQHSNGQMAIDCFEEMRQDGVEPNDATFICLLVACSHEGLVNEGQQFFKVMVEDYSLEPTVHHYCCMVDLLGRSGHLEEAEHLLRSMPVPSDVVGWTSLLNACKYLGDIDRGRKCFDRLHALEPQNGAAYMVMECIYRDAGRWEDVECLQALRKSAGVCKKPARAWIEVNSKVHTFCVGEGRDDISSKLRSVNMWLEEDLGHVSQAEAPADRKKQDALCGHAEKLALAYGLLNTADGTTLLVTKNLRMCNDCHSGTKAMSRLEQREIIVRDAHRVHHFVNGFCSCGDLIFDTTTAKHLCRTVNERRHEALPLLLGTWKNAKQEKCSHCLLTHICFKFCVLSYIYQMPLREVVLRDI